MPRRTLVAFTLLFVAASLLWSSVDTFGAEKLTVTGLNVFESHGDLRIRIGTSVPPTFTTFLLSSPIRLVLDITSVSGVCTDCVGEFNALGVRIKTVFGPKSGIYRVIVNLPEGVDYDLIPEQGALVLVLTAPGAVPISALTGVSSIVRIGTQQTGNTGKTVSNRVSKQPKAQARPAKGEVEAVAVAEAIPTSRAPVQRSVSGGSRQPAPAASKETNTGEQPSQVAQAEVGKPSAVKLSAASEISEDQTQKATAQAIERSGPKPTSTSKTPSVNIPSLRVVQTGKPALTPKPVLSLVTPKQPQKPQKEVQASVSKPKTPSGATTTPTAASTKERKLAVSATPAQKASAETQELPTPPRLVLTDTKRTYKAIPILSIAPQTKRGVAQKTKEEKPRVAAARQAQPSAVSMRPSGGSVAQPTGTPNLKQTVSNKRQLSAKAKTSSGTQSASEVARKSNRPTSHGIPRLPVRKVSVKAASTSQAAKQPKKQVKVAQASPSKPQTKPPAKPTSKPNLVKRKVVVAKPKPRQEVLKKSPQPTPRVVAKSTTAHLQPSKPKLSTEVRLPYKFATLSNPAALQVLSLKHSEDTSKLIIITERPVRFRAALKAENVLRIRLLATRMVKKVHMFPMYASTGPVYKVIPSYRVADYSFDLFLYIRLGSKVVIRRAKQGRAIVVEVSPKPENPEEVE